MTAKFVVKLCNANSPSGVAYLGPGKTDAFSVDSEDQAFRFEKAEASQFADHFIAWYRGFVGGATIVVVPVDDKPEAAVKDTHSLAVRQGIKPDAFTLQGKDMKRLMRVNRMTMRAIKQAHNITLKRIREVCAKGASGFAAAEWVWIITGRWPDGHKPVTLR